MERIKPSVLKIVTDLGTGSGFIYNVNGQSASVITNRHVVEGATSIQAVYEGSTFQAQYVSTDPVRDLAVLEVCCSTSFKALRIAYWGDAKLGTEVYALGYPLGLGTVRVTAGLVSGLDYYTDGDEHWIQTDAALNPGNSGGPLVLLSGEVVGVNFGGLRYDSHGQPLEGFGFAISARTIDRALPGMESTLRTVTSPAPTLVPTPEGEWDFSLNSLEMPHDDDGSIELYRVFADASGFLIRADFQVPYSSDIGTWSIGFLFRQTEDNTFSYVAVQSTGFCIYRIRSEGTDVDREQCYPTKLRTGSGEWNSLMLYAGANIGRLHLGHFDTGSFEDREFFELDLGYGFSGELSVAVGLLMGDEVLGYVTRVRNIRANNND